MKFIKKIKTKEEISDLEGWKIPKGTILFVIKRGPKHRIEGYRVLVVRVDNGTGILKLMPETAIREKNNLSRITLR